MEQLINSYLNWEKEVNGNDEWGEKERVAEENKEKENGQHPHHVKEAHVDEQSNVWKKWIGW